MRIYTGVEIVASFRVMSEHCRICEEIARFSPAVVIARTNTASAVAPERARVLGTAMIVVHRHVISFEELDETEIAEVAQLTHVVSARITRTLRPDGLSVWWHVGPPAGQIDPHFLVELVPRYADVPFPFGDTSDPKIWSDEERKDLARRLARDAIP